MQQSSITTTLKALMLAGISGELAHKVSRYMTGSLPVCGVPLSTALPGPGLLTMLDGPLVNSGVTLLTLFGGAAAISRTSCLGPCFLLTSVKGIFFQVFPFFQLMSSKTCTLSKLSQSEVVESRKC